MWHECGNVHCLNQTNKQIALICNVLDLLCGGLVHKMALCYRKNKNETPSLKISEDYFIKGRTTQLLGHVNPHLEGQRRKTLCFKRTCKLWEMVGDCICFRLFCFSLQGKELII